MGTQSRHNKTTLAKITPPRLSTVFPRKRLFKLLDQARKKPVTWLSAPAGYGKTTLVASYLKTRRIRHIWYQCDVRDTDPATFFYYLHEAAKKLAPRKRDRLPLLTAEYRLGLPAFVRNFFDRLFGRFNPPFVMVFDNYHDLPETSVLHGLLPSAFDDAPDGFGIIVLSRRDPPPSFARVRAAQRLELVDKKSLNLAHDELRGFVQLHQGTRLSERIVNQLYAHTQGWAAGVTLLLEQASQSGENEPRFAQITDTLVFDYFAEEIFNEIDSDTQDFLLALSVFHQINADMAETLTHHSNARVLLNTLARKNFFTNRLAGAEPVFQFHPLFHDFLKARARERFAEPDWRAIQQKAAALLVDHRQLEDAAELMRSIGDHQGLITLIPRGAPMLVVSGRYSVLRQWLDMASAKTTGAIPWLDYWNGVYWLINDPEQARHHFERAYVSFAQQHDEVGRSLSWSGMVDAIGFAMNNLQEADKWISEMARTLTSRPAFPSADIEAQIIRTGINLLVWRNTGYRQAQTWVSRALNLYQATEDKAWRIKLGQLLCMYYDWQGELEHSDALMATIQRLKTQEDLPPLEAINSKIVEGHYYWMRADLEGNKNATLAGLEMADQHGIHVLDLHLLSGAIYTPLGQYDQKEADRLLTLIGAMLATGGRNLDVAHYHSLIAWSAMLGGELERAQAAARLSIAIADTVGATIPQVYCTYALANVLIARGQFDEADTYLDRVAIMAEAMQSALLGYMHGLANSWLLLLRGNQAECLAQLAPTMALGRERGLIQTFFWLPEMIAGLCQQALSHDIEPDYARLLIRRRGLYAYAAHSGTENWPYPVKLYTLGRFELKIDDAPVSFSAKGKKKPMDLLKALVAFGGKEVGEAKLSEALWPDAEGDSAYRSFATTLHRLRKLLGHDEALIITEGKLSLDRRYCWVDAWALNHELAGLERPDTLDDDALGHAVDRILTLYQGPFLANDHEHQWLLGYREQLRSRWLRAVKTLAGELGARQQCAHAMRCYQRGLEIDNLAEDFYRGLLTCHIVRGEKGEAYSLYRRCEQALMGLGITPSPQTRALAEAIPQAGEAAVINGLCAACRSGKTPSP